MPKKAQELESHDRPPDRSWKRHCAAAALIILAGIIAYSNSTQGSFHFDDRHSIVTEPSIRSLNPVTVWHGARTVGYYSFALNYRLNGLEDVRGWHYVNIGLHIAAALMLYAFLFLIGLGREVGRASLIAAVLFAVHPLCSEPVNYIQARHVIFYALFSLSGAACVALYLRAESAWRRILYGAGGAASVLLAGLSKEVGVCYAVLTAGLYLLIFEREWFQKRKWAWAAAGVAAAAVGIVLAHGRYLSKVVQGASHPMLGYVSYPSYVLTQVTVFWKYVWLFVPLSSSLSMDHGVNVMAASGAAQVLVLLASAAGIGALLGIGWKQRVARPALSFLCLWGVLAFFPYLFIQGSGEFMVEYRAYLPAMGFIALAALGLERLGILLSGRESRPRRRLVITMIALVLLVAVCIRETRARNAVWKDDLSLWTDAAEKAPEEARVHYRLAVVYHRNGMPREAIGSLNRTIQLRPDFALAYNDLGGVYHSTGEREKSVAAYRKALELSPEYAEAHRNLGIVLRETGREEEARTRLDKALQTNSGALNACLNLGMTYTAAGEHEKAAAAFERAVRIAPDSAEAHHRLGLAYRDIGKTEKAEAAFRRAIEADPGYTKAHNDLGFILSSTGRKAEAIKLYLAAIERDPEYASLYVNLATAYAGAGKRRKAVATYRKALELDPKNARAHLNLGLTYTAMGNAGQAGDCYRKALELDSELAPAHAALAVVYYNEMKYDLAVKHCDTARRLSYAVPEKLKKAIDAVR